MSAMVPRPGRLASEEEMAELARRERADVLERRLFFSGLPAEFRHASLARCDPRVRGWSGAGPSRGLVIRGLPGRGKSYAAAALLVSHAASRGTVAWATTEDFAEASCSICGEAGLLRYVRPSLLVVDDLGRGRMGERAAAGLWYVVSGRWSRLRPTVITTSHTDEALLRIVGRVLDLETAEALMSRLSCLPCVELGGPDRRGSRSFGREDSRGR